MKIPVEWLKDYINTKKSAKDLAKSFTAIGLMLDKPVFTYENGKYKTEMLDLEHRMDRADWLSIFGCACDLAAFENADLIMPKLYTEKGKALSDKVKIEVKCPELVNRFNTRVFKNIKVGPSPDWLKNRLEAYGIPSKNNIVDITNYVMVEMGQPMHAQDLNKMEAREIVIRRAKKGEQMVTLLGETVTLDEEVFVLTQKDKATVIGGIVGGKATGVDETTTEIVLDAGNYNQTNIRKSSRRLKIINESSSRNDKFLHPELTEVAIQRATGLILELAGGEYYENEDWYPKVHPTKKLTLKFDRLKTISGVEFKVERVKEILTRLEYKALKENKDSLDLEIPFFRTDVEVEDDIVSDVLRINDYANIVATDISSAPPKDITPKIYLFEEMIRDLAVNLGLYEHITDPLVAATDEKSQVKLENSQSALKNALRRNAYDGLKSLASVYAKHGINTVKLFEVGKVYWRLNKSKNIEDFIESRVTQVYIKIDGATYLENSIETRSVLDGFMRGLGIANYKIDLSKHIMVGEKVIGTLEWDQFTLLNEELLPLKKSNNRVVTEFSTKKTDDISIVTTKEKSLGDIEESIRNTEGVLDVEILPQNFENNSLVRITHKSEDFKPLKEKVVKMLKANGANVK